MLRLLQNGDRKLMLVVAISFAALLTVVTVSVARYGLPGSQPPPEFEIFSGVPEMQRALPGEEIAIGYRVCNRTGDAGSALLFASWVSAEGIVERDAPMQGAALTNLLLPEGCTHVVLDRLVPIVPGTWRRVGLLIAVFTSGRTELLALASQPVEVALE